MKQKHWCGITTKTGTVLSGVFIIMATQMYLIFEQNYLEDGGCIEANLWSKGIGKLINEFLLCWSWKIVLFLSIVTIIISYFLLYAVYAQNYKGLLLYIIWIPVFETVNIIIQILTNDPSELAAVRVIRWFGLVSHIFMHCFWMFFVIDQTHTIYKIKRQGNILSYHRCVSMVNGEFSHWKSKKMSFPLHH